MARARKKLLSLTPQKWNEIWGVLLLFAAPFLFMSLISYHPGDLPFFTTQVSTDPHNLCGKVGAWIAGATRSTLGWTSFLLPMLAVLWALAFFNGTPVQRPGLKLGSTVLLCLAASSLLSIVWAQAPEARVERGGVIGVLAGDQAVQYFGWWGARVVLLTVGLICLIVSTEMTVWPLLRAGGEAAAGAGRWLGGRAGESAAGLWKNWAERRTTVVHRTDGGRTIRVNTKVQTQVADDPEEILPPKIKLPPAVEVPTAPVRPSPLRPFDKLRAQGSGRMEPRAARAEPVEARAVQIPFQLPSSDLLNPPASPQAGQSKEQIEAQAKVLEETLREFGLEARVAEVELGPVITRYEVEPAPGVKIQKIATLSDDLALALKSSSVRVIAPIPGKGRVGIEVPNLSTSLVTLREVLQSKEFQQARSKLTLAIGQDATGHPLVADLGGMPHLLIAGATGSGKTVCMNGLIISLLFNATPDEVRFLMVDPKMVELAPFNGLPHLLMPVLTSPKKVPAALEWVIDEMETRYRLFAKLGVRNIDGYHERSKAGQLPKEEVPDSLPFLIVIVDELADLMLVAQAEVEKSIARLAHLSRAVGIHMVLATQRPSVDVLTGVIKANFPARISFQVASRVDSRTVLDTIGAEKLLGKGDLLFMPPGASKLIRAQGTLVTDQEIERVVQFWKGQQAPSYEVALPEETEGSRYSVGGEREKDPLHDEAVRVVVETGQASVSLLQRRMRLGYGRAARILDRMEEEGIVGPIRGAKPREVFLKDLPGLPRPSAISER